MPHHYYRDEYDCEVLLDQVVPVGIVVVGNRRDRQVVQVEINPEHGEGQKRTAEGNEIQKKTDLRRNRFRYIFLRRDH